MTASGQLGFSNTGVITQYGQGAVIDVDVKVTAFHGGKFEFRVQNVGGAADPDGAAWQALPKLPVVSFAPACVGCAAEACAPTGSADGTCAQIPLTHPGGDCGYKCSDPYRVRVRLPADLTCEHCVLQVKSE